MGIWREFNNNPAGRRVGDCAVRAVSVALGIDWESAYCLIADAGFNMADMPASDSVWGAVLRQHGFYREAISNDCEDCYTAADFAIDHPKGIYVLGFTGHVAAVIDGQVWDSFDSTGEIVNYYWGLQEGD